VPKVGDHDVSPYLTQRLRSIEEVQAERERRRRELGREPQTPAQPAPQPPSQPVKPAAESSPTGGQTAKRPGQVLDEKA
jgi:hypothetical protein